MRVVIQRVKKASVSVDDRVVGSIGVGLLVLLGITQDDSQADIDYLVRKICGLRIFPDAHGTMNLSIEDVDADILVISQFTLYAETKKGNRPSYINAARPEIAIPLYEAFMSSLSRKRDRDIPTGTFGADMQVSLVNDGPVTIILDSKE
ncbi:D-aminoacyl-tRNA deacylase [Nonlabens marinus]|uniref:D-aminoacyl-tRNA deacylase n=1 Tax=Nonlabens marinus S1-08 TaxID=1454201 RepID=W8VZD4_9FLAO|nr:D-aminoacyl-tRNA deacylase [Nonlabens marinus]BAO54381.1 D-tyrosyl-tRNA(Tyr) deacylase [Nonlabens marinus S1-08]